MATTTHHSSQNIYHIYITEFNIYKDYFAGNQNCPTQSFDGDGVKGQRPCGVSGAAPLNKNYFGHCPMQPLYEKSTRFQKSAWINHSLDELFICL